MSLTCRYRLLVGSSSRRTHRPAGTYNSWSITSHKNHLTYLSVKPGLPEKDFLVTWDPKWNVNPELENLKTPNTFDREDVQIISSRCDWLHFVPHKCPVIVEGEESWTPGRDVLPYRTFCHLHTQMGMSAWRTSLQHLPFLHYLLFLQFWNLFSIQTRHSSNLTLFLIGTNIGT